jgi:RNA polymerase sigma-70 factor (ECF subfamily)
MALSAKPGDEHEFALLEAWRRGDREAGDALMRTYYDRVARFFVAKAGFVAEDLTQRTLLACTQAIGTFRGESTFKAYVFAIARRQYLDHLRWAGRQDAAMRRLDFDQDEFGTPLSARLARRQEQHLVLQALARIPEVLSTAVQLYYWEDMRTADIGLVLEIPASTVSSRLARARALLRAAVAELSGTSPVGVAVLGDLEAWTRSLARSSDEPDAS